MSEGHPEGWTLHAADVPALMAELERRGELQLSFVRASGPGGQNVNKVASAVQLRFDAAACPSLPPAVRDRLLRLAGQRATDAGVVVIDARRHRSQEQNRRDALARLEELLVQAARRPVPRRPTRPSRAARERRMEGKHHRGSIKRTRQTPTGGDE